MQGMVAGSDRHPPGMEIPGGRGGGSKAKMPYVGRVVTTSVLTE